MTIAKFNNRLSIVSALGISLILALAVPRSVDAGFGKNVSGSYLLEQSDGFMQILTLTDKGGAFSQNNGQFTGANQFGDQQGAWKKTGRRQIKIETLDFTFNVESDSFTGFGRSTFAAEFQKGFDALTGTVFVEIFSFDQDPLDPNAIPLQTFGPNEFTGRRITAH